LRGYVRLTAINTPESNRYNSYLVGAALTHRL